MTTPYDSPETTTFFNGQKFLQRLISVSLYFLVFRVFFTFLFAFLFAQEWHVEKVFGWLPIIAFNTDAETFIDMNSYAVFASAAAVFGMFLLYALKKGSRLREYAWAWYSAVLMTFVQYVVLILLNGQIHFGVSIKLWLPLFVITFGATLIIVSREHFWRKDLPQDTTYLQ